MLHNSLLYQTIIRTTDQTTSWPLTTCNSKLQNEVRPSSRDSVQQLQILAWEVWAGWHSALHYFNELFVFCLWNCKGVGVSFLSFHKYPEWVVYVANASGSNCTWCSRNVYSSYLTNCQIVIVIFLSVSVLACCMSTGAGKTQNLIVQGRICFFVSNWQL